MEKKFSWKSLDVVRMVADELRKGRSATDIGKILTKVYGERISKNAVHGALNRVSFIALLKATVLDAEIILREYQSRSKTRNKETAGKMRHKVQAQKNPAPAPVKKVGSLLDKLPPPKKTTLLPDLEEGMCGFTYGDVGEKDFTYCARATKGHKRYCPEHRDEMFQPLQRSERKKKRDDEPQWNFGSQYRTFDFRN